MMFVMGASIKASQRVIPVEVENEFFGSREFKEFSYTAGAAAAGLGFSYAGEAFKIGFGLLLGRGQGTVAVENESDESTSTNKLTWISGAAYEWKHFSVGIFGTIENTDVNAEYLHIHIGREPITTYVEYRF